MLQAENAVHTERDLTRHAELVLVSEACKRLSEEERRKCTLFTSTEPSVLAYFTHPVILVQ